MNRIKKEIGKRWLIIYTHNLNPSHFEQFKELLGDPMKKKWYAFPSEFVKKVEVVGPWTLADFIHAIADKIKRWLYR